MLLDHGHRGVRAERRQRHGRRRLRRTSRRRRKGRASISTARTAASVRRGGEGLQALQHIVATAFRKQLGDDNRIVVDCNGYPQGQGRGTEADGAFHRREGARAAACRRRWARSIRTSAGSSTWRSPRIRRVRSESIGDAFMKTVIISGESSGWWQWCHCRHQSMFSPDDTIVAIATPPGRGGIGVVRISGPRPPRSRRRFSTRPARIRAATRDVHRGRASTARSGARRSRRDVLSRTAFIHRRGRRRDQRPRQSRRAARHRRARDRRRRAARRARRVHAARVSQRQARSRSGGSGRRSDRRRTPLQARIAFDQLEGTLTDAHRGDRRALVRSDRAARGVARFSGRGLSLRRGGRECRRDRSRDLVDSIVCSPTRSAGE